MTNFNNLFHTSNREDEEARILASRLRFEGVMEEHIPRIISVIEEAFDAMSDEISGRSPSYLNHLSRSNRMNEQIKGRITDEYGTTVKRLPYNRFGLFIGGYVILFKKLDKFGRPMNIPTTNSIALTGQGVLNFPGEPEIIHVGYTVDPSWEAIRKINAVKVEDQQVVWSSDLKAFAAARITTIIPKVIETDEEQLDVKPKQASSKLKAG